MKIILGSSSPRRREILSALVPSFDVMTPDADETILPDEDPISYALRVADAKVRSIRAHLPTTGEKNMIIACDTIVTIEGRIIGKPEDQDHAKAIIGRLAGRTHRVISALSLVLTGDPERIETGRESSAVTFKHLSDEQIEDYLARIHYMDKAGAYAVQEWGHLIIDRIEGSVTNVIGFPLGLFFRMVADMNITGEIFLARSPIIS